MGCRLADSIKSIVGFVKLITVPSLRKRMSLLFGRKNADMFRDRGRDGHD